MRLNAVQAIIIIICIVAGTMITRFLPFVLFPEGKKHPKIVDYLSATIPPAVMGLLTVYCLRNVQITEAPHGLPEIIAVTITVLLHLWRRNVLFSILVGTVVYMLLVQMVFV